MLLARSERIDPLYLGLRRLFKGWFLTAIVIGIIHVAIWIIVSYLVQKPSDSYTNKELISFSNDAFGWFQWAITVPLIWSYYRWLPEAILASVQKLYNNQVISDFLSDVGADLNNTSDAESTVLEERLTKALGGFGVTSLAIAFAMVMVMAQYWVIRPTELSSGLFPVWYATRWSILVLEPITWINGYVSAQFATRAVLISVVLRRFFQKSKLQHVFLYHPDGGGGFGELGRFAMKLALFSVIIGFWAVGITLAPVLAGGRPNFSIPVLAVYGLYLILVPFTLLSIVWPVHEAMSHFKHQRLRVLSSEIQQLIESLFSQVVDRPGAAAASIAKLEELRDLYKIVGNIPEWPFTSPDISRFGGIAILPALLGLVSFLLDLINNWPF
jgi:hypothetical protein